MFDGNLGKYTGYNYTIELKDNAKPYHANPLFIRNIHEPTIKNEVNRLIKIGVLKKINNFQSTAHTFIIPKMNGTMEYISDFRELNKRIKTKPFPIPNHSTFINNSLIFSWKMSGLLHNLIGNYRASNLPHGNTIVHSFKHIAYNMM